MNCNDKKWTLMVNLYFLPLRKEGLKHLKFSLNSKAFFSVLRKFRRNIFLVNIYSTMWVTSDKPVLSSIICRVYIGRQYIYYCSCTFFELQFFPFTGIDTDELDSHRENMIEETIEFIVKVEETIIKEWRKNSS